MENERVELPAEHRAVVAYLLTKVKQREAAFRDAQQEYQQYLVSVATSLKLDNVQYRSDEMVFVRVPKPTKDGKVPALLTEGPA